MQGRGDRQTETSLCGLPGAVRGWAVAAYVGCQGAEPGKVWHEGPSYSPSGGWWPGEAWLRTSEASGPNPALRCCVALGKSLHLSEPRSNSLD